MEQLGAVKEAVTVMIASLEADGYELHVEEKGPVVKFRIVAGADACEECLAPQAVMDLMIKRLLADAGLDDVRWQLQYPS